MTVVGKPSVPGARFPGQVSPRSAVVLPDDINTPDEVPFVGWNLPDRVPLPGDTVSVKTPFPDFDVSVRQDRWDYFLDDTMPAFERLLDEPGRATMTSEMARPLEERIDDQRMLRRSPDVDRYLSRDWSLERG